ncbi:MAG TPA: bifunctional UDP-3-O-[3-hydroxymyristoyl] N-acetylglucosamine deacetylase/3-hydroxyacyl-ACP dehydratase [Candidatus Methylacidiphilales bacterium]|jgi:UDP-3-O-[3-hydroxymyristoyl] N-acetylglucosamine deacetylase/3-hydroxyacyl-[acyl-carrier-protein] dehydratase|nr:bifunctional UDP-3-O-[3-hydroxymyristoyl] N-acetylglucosamine deacetylase/3-hydroxyacyl-ACP dehydratase [Candidatus Methylacidiphilales bacterium]
MASLKQTTVAHAQTVKGSALHTGSDVTLTVKPAAANTGFVFKRTDLADEPTVAAHIDNVKQVERATTLGEGSVKIHTVEHLLSALRGLGIDNAVIEINANEPPIGDGSGRIFTELLERAGKTELDAPVAEYELTEPVRVTSRDGGYIIAWPSDRFEISCTNANHLGKHTQFRTWNPETGNYAKDIAQARTFVFYEEVQPLMEKGLIKGGSLENAVVIRGDAILSREPLRYEDEFVRHKILDIVGDLSLFPVRLRAHIYAVKPSHALNVELAREIYKQYKHRQAQRAPAEGMPVGEGAMDAAEIMKVLPHRHPFLLVDRILGFEGTTRVIGQKAVTMNEPFFPGHFPGHPVMPGVLQVEAMAQVASILLFKATGVGGKIGYFMSADKVKWRKPVLPGDTLIIEVEMTKFRGKVAKATGICRVKNDIVSEAELMFGIVDA